MCECVCNETGDVCDARCALRAHSAPGGFLCELTLMLLSNFLGIIWKTSARTGVKRAAASAVVRLNKASNQCVFINTLWFVRFRQFVKLFNSLFVAIFICLQK